MGDYNKVTESLVKELRRIAGDKAVIYEDKEALESYSADESGGKYYAHMPDVVVKPENSEQIAKIVNLANKEHIPITPRGAGSGLAGGAVPLYGGIVISLERMNSFWKLIRRILLLLLNPGL